MPGVRQGFNWLTINKAMKKLFCILLLTCLPLSAGAREVSGITVPELAHVGKTTLILNGAGVRIKAFFFHVYVGALYLDKKMPDTAAILADKGAKRIELHVVRHISADTFMEAFEDGFNANNNAQQSAALSARLARFSKAMRGIGAVNDGTVVRLDYLPADKETLLTVDGKKIVHIEGVDFYAALLRIWLGPNAVQASLKKELLGG